MVGTTTASGSRLNVMASSATEVSFQVSGVDLTPFLRVAKDGTVGVSTYSAANLDVNGTGDDSSIGLMLHSGNLYGGGTNRFQMTFGQKRHGPEPAPRHQLGPQRLDDAQFPGFLDLVDGPSARRTIATMTASPSSRSRRRPGRRCMCGGRSLEVEFVASDGASLGGGTIHVAASVTPSSPTGRPIFPISASMRRDRGLHAGTRAQARVFRYARLKNGRYVRKYALAAAAA